MVVTPVNGHNRPRPQSPGAELYQELVHDSRFLLTTSPVASVIIARSPCILIRAFDQGGGCFGKTCLERQKAGWLDGCHGVMRKAVNAVNVVNSVQITIYPRRSEPFIGNQKQSSLWFFRSKPSDGLTEYFDRCTEIQATPCCVMINVLLLCSQIFSINSVTAIIITICLL